MTTDDLLRARRLKREIRFQRRKHDKSGQRMLSARFCDAETFADACGEMWEEWGKLRSLENELCLVEEKIRGAQ